MNHDGTLSESAVTTGVVTPLVEADPVAWNAGLGLAFSITLTDDRISARRGLRLKRNAGRHGVAYYHLGFGLPVRRRYSARTFNRCEHHGYHFMVLRRGLFKSAFHGS